MKSQALALSATGDHFADVPAPAGTPWFRPLRVDGGFGPARLPDTDEFDLNL